MILCWKHDWYIESVEIASGFDSAFAQFSQIKYLQNGQKYTENLPQSLLQKWQIRLKSRLIVKVDWSFLIVIISKFKQFVLKIAFKSSSKMI